MHWGIPIAMSACAVAITVQHSPPTFEVPARTAPLPAEATAACIRDVVRQARQQEAAHTFPPTSRPWTEDERASGTAVSRRVYDFKRRKMRGCLTDRQAEAYGRVDIFILMKAGQACGIATTPAAAADVIEGAAAGSMTAAAADVIEGAAAGSMTADDKPLGAFFAGQDLARRDLAGINADGRWRDGTKPRDVCATYFDLFGPKGRQFAGLLKVAGR